MKSLILAGALLHTFSVNSPQPYKAVASNTLDFNMTYMAYETIQNGNKTIMGYKTKTELGLYNIDLYKFEYWHQDLNEVSTKDGILIYGIVTRNAVNTITEFQVDQNINIYSPIIDYYYFNQGLGDTNMETYLATNTYTSLYNLMNYARGAINQPTETPSTTGNFTENITISNPANTFSFYFVWQNEDVPYDFQASNTQISYTYTYNTDSTGEVVDVGGLLWDILAMPFSFISTAFNLTIFPNTPYQINVANILFTLIAGLMIIWIVRRFTR